MSGQKLPIYPLPEREIVVVEQTSALEEHIGVARRHVQALYADAYGQVHGVVSRWIEVEHSIERRIKSLHAPDEQLNPGLLYIGVAALSGSVLARGRNIVIRTLLPPTLFVAASSHFLPKTTHNVRSYFAELEEKHTPQLAYVHNTGIAHTRMTWDRAVEAIIDGRRVTGEKTEGIVKKVEEATGLKLGQVFGGGKAVAKKAEVIVAQKVEQVAEATKERAEAVKAEAEPQVKEAEKAVQVEELSAKTDKLPYKKDEIVEEVKRIV
ncbi:hypothetical protein PENSPDRAFT_619360 [Peniophora sp. CONT]|nr:hypothetical protein PENSPDRAFT_619360 [Peniophora sp. CONT]